MDIHKAFRLGAEILAQNNCRYTNLHKGHGIEQFQWEMLTQDEYWSPDQIRQIRSVLANAIEVSMTISGMPPVPLPGQYVAALIAIVVKPVNRMVACTKAPETFDAIAASGLVGTFEVKKMSVEQLMALVLAYSSGFPGEPPGARISKDVKTIMKKEAVK